LSTTLFISSAYAEPCVVEKNKWGIWVGDCLSIEALGKQELIAVIINFVNGTTVHIEVRTGNNGTITSRDFDVTVNITLSGGGMTAQTISITGLVYCGLRGFRKWRRNP
jgi:hypothetical protein